MTQTLTPPSQTLSFEPTDKHWTHDEYEQLIGTGIFEGKHVQLIFGRILQMSPQYVPHTVGVELVSRFARKAFPNLWVRIQMPLEMTNDSEPEPDIAVVEGPIRGAKNHPSTALLVVEVSDSSLRLDRVLKASLYALNGIADYWILNLVDKKLEVHREPQLNSDGTGVYKSIHSFAATDRVAPLAAPSHEILVADLLP